MNDARRKAIKAALAKVDEAAGKLDEAKADLEAVRDEEQEYYDNIPENMQSGEKGEKAQEAIDALDEMISNIEQAHDDAQGVVNEDFAQ